MKEIINVCLSQPAGHLQCHFNNQQETYLDYSGAEKRVVDPSIFLRPVLDRATRTLSYTPRTVLLDCKNGYGSLGKYEYFAGENSHQDEVVGKLEKIQLGERIPKNEYQRALDQNDTELPKLTENDTKYWTDYTRLIYDPKSFNEVPNWVYKDRKTVMKFDPSRELTDFEVGVQEFKTSLHGTDLAASAQDDFFDDVFRVFVERCDNLSGLNFVSEIDSSWGGINEQLLIEIRDEHLPKTAVTTWGLYAEKSNDKVANILSRIKSTVANASNSSLFIPMNLPGLSTDSLWRSTAELSLLFESVNLLYARAEDPISMTDFINGITMGTKRNIVTDIALASDGISADLTAKVFSPVSSHFFSKSVVSRYTTDASFNNFESLVAQGTSEKGLIDYTLPIPFKPADSFPKAVVKSNQYHVSLGTSDRLRSSFKDMRAVVSRRMKDDDREFYIDELENYLAEYEFGWSDDEEYD